MTVAHAREAWWRRANEIRARTKVSSVIGRVVVLKHDGSKYAGRRRLAASRPAPPRGTTTINAAHILAAHLHG